MISTILFDLDGTLVDTAPDLGYALNIQLCRHGKPALSDATIRPYASHGSKGLLGLGFGITPEDASFSALREEYLNIYDEVFTRSPVLLDGIAELLQAIEKKRLKWGIVTNKPRRFTLRLIESMGLHQRAACIISGDDAAKPKPSPETLLLACKQVGVKPQACVYVGDAERDVVAAKAAGMKTVVALFGYIADVSDKPHEWGADALIQTPAELLGLLAENALFNTACAPIAP
ncbi:MAG: HAD-IA family hydrolase [Methylotenera sp.]